MITIAQVSAKLATTPASAMATDAGACAWRVSASHASGRCQSRLPRRRRSRSREVRITAGTRLMPAKSNAAMAR